MQNCKIEQNDQQVIQQGNAGTATQLQVMPTVLGHTASGQQILLQSLQQNIGANGQQSIQVVPIHGLGHHQGGTIIVQQQPQVQQPQPQIVQLPDGQFYISQPILPETQAQTQIVNINGNYYQIPTQQHQQAAPAQTTSQNTATLQGSPASNVQATQNSSNQQVVMMTTSAPTVSSPVQNDPQGNVTNLINTNSSSISPPPNSSSPTPAVESEEEPLYVNASK